MLVEVLGGVAVVVGFFEAVVCFLEVVAEVVVVGVEVSVSESSESEDQVISSWGSWAAPGDCVRYAGGRRGMGRETYLSALRDVSALPLE